MTDYKPGDVVAVQGEVGAGGAVCVKGFGVDPPTRGWIHHVCLPPSKHIAPWLSASDQEALMRLARLATHSPTCNSYGVEYDASLSDECNCGYDEAWYSISDSLRDRVMGGEG